MVPTLQKPEMVRIDRWPRNGSSASGERTGTALTDATAQLRSTVAPNASLTPPPNSLVACSASSRELTHPALRHGSADLVIANARTVQIARSVPGKHTRLAPNSKRPAPLSGTPAV